MTQKRPAQPERSRSFAVSAWPLRFKVGLAIALPLLLAATLGLLQVRSDLVDAANSSQSARQVTILGPAVEYLSSAEAAMVAAQDTSGSSDQDVQAAIKDVHTAYNQLTATASNADLTASERYQLDAMLDLSRAIREANTESLSPGTWVAQLRQLQSHMTQLITSIQNAQINPEPNLELLSQTLAGRFSLAMQQALAATESTGGTSALELYAELGVEGAAIDRLATSLGDSEPAIAALRTENAQRTRTVRTGGDDLGGPAAYNEYDNLTSTLLGDIDQQLATSASDARRSALISGGIVLGALLATLLLAFLVSRLLLGPISRVREGARKVAHEELPEAVARIRAGEDPGPITPIDVTTHEEVGQLARAVDDLHEQAVTLASGEAKLRSQVSEMFTTLSRRNTSLINQQLGLIETLEKDEEDPRRLESLFRLDHLASRMRRTADSLLVLADAPPQSSADDDLTVASALQAATAGVQAYQRVRVGSASTARISDDAAADVVHLLTELVDNALTFSSPTTTVLVSSTAAPTGVSVEIEDSGLGIPDGTMSDLNQTLRRGAEVTPDTARRMGLFVVSRLAKRHGITVTLRRNKNKGTTASVLLPRSILDVLPPTIDAGVPPLRVVEPVPAPAPEPAATIAPAVAAAVAQPSLEDRLGAAGLPRRQPGAQVPETAPVPPPAPPAPPMPVRRAEPPAELTAPRASFAPMAPAASVRDTAAERDVPAATSDSTESVEETTVEETTVEPRTAAAVAAASDTPTTRTHTERWDDLPAFPTVHDSEAEADTPIFRALRSAWLSTNATAASWRTSEIEAGWARADRVEASTTEAPVNAAGLPVRQPGTRIVPGGVAKPSRIGSRDPDAIRARLTAHAAGVSRGRAAAATTHDHKPSEEAPHD